MTKVVVLTDTTDYKLPPAVEAAYNTAVQAAIATGVSNAIAGSGDTATAVANAVTAMTTTTILKTANVTPGTGKNAITGWFHADGFGAVGNGSTNSRSAIQAALDAAEAIYNTTAAPQTVYLPPGVYMVDAVAYYLQNGTQNGVTSLVLHSGVNLTGHGTIKLVGSAYGSGANFAVIRSNSQGISNASIRGITVDGNRANNVASDQCSNVVIDAVANVDVIDTKQFDANGTAIMVKGSTATIASNIRIRGNTVRGASTIGIQSSQFDGLDISGNNIVGTTNNAIDVYGENGTTTAHAGNFTINDNRVYGGLTGVFLETVAGGVVSGNYLAGNTEAGVHVNRINGEPTYISIVGNVIDTAPAGVAITGDAGTVDIRANKITRVTLAGVRLGGGGSRVSGLNIVDNSIDTTPANSVALVLVQTNTNQWDRTKVRRTMTFNTNHAYDVVNYATTTTSNVSYDASNS